MLEELISISTLMICTLLATSIIGIFLLQLWLTDRRHAAAGYWCLSMWSGTLCTALLAARPIGLPLLTTGLGNGLAMLAYALTWAGFRVFDRRPLRLWLVAAGPAVWTLAYLTVPAVASDVNARIVVTSLIISAYSILTGVDMWRGRRAEPLPTRSIAAVFFVTHGLVYSLRIPAVLLAPVHFAHGTAYSPWFALLSLEVFAHTILTAIAMLVLVKERGEALYRAASRTDALTGIANRASFLEDVGRHLAGRAEGTLILFDIDRFKAVNDTYGHLAGDAVLKAFSACVSARLEPDMLFSRFGGEEFALFAPGRDAAEAARVAEGLRRAVESMTVWQAGQGIAVSVSIGLADVATFGADFDRLHSAADHALYAAKAGGRNRVVPAAPSAGLPEMAGRMRLVEASPPVSAAG